MQALGYQEGFPAPGTEEQLVWAGVRVGGGGGREKVDMETNGRGQGDLEAPVGHLPGASLSREDR